MRSSIYPCLPRLLDINFAFLNELGGKLSIMEFPANGVVNKKRCHTLDPDYKVTIVPQSKVPDSRVTFNRSPDRERWWPQKRHQASFTDPIASKSDRQRIFSQSSSFDKRREGHRSSERNKSFNRGKRRDFLASNDPSSRRHRTKPSSASPLRYET